MVQAHKFPITDLGWLLNDKWLISAEFVSARCAMKDFNLFFVCHQAPMWLTENQLINHRQHDPAQLFMQMMENQEIKSRMDKNVPRRRKKRRLGGVLICWHHKQFESWESLRGVVAVTAHCRILRFVSATAAPIFRGILCALGILVNSMKAQLNHSLALAHLSDSLWPFNLSVSREVSVFVRLKFSPMMVSSEFLFKLTT